MTYLQDSSDLDGREMLVSNIKFLEISHNSNLKIPQHTFSLLMEADWCSG